MGGRGSSSGNKSRLPNYKNAIIQRRKLNKPDGADIDEVVFWCDYSEIEIANK